MIRISLFLYLLFSTFSVMVFFLPLYFSSKGLTAGQIGTIVACGSMIAMVAQPFWGFVSDKRKTVKGVLVTVMAASFLTSIGLFSVDTLLLIALFYVGFMAFNSACAPMTETLCVSYAHQHNKEYGRVRMWGEIGVGTSAFALGLLVERIGIGYFWLIYLVAMGIAILAGVFLLRDTQATPTPVDIRALGKLFRAPKLLWFMLLILLVSIPHRMNDSMLALYLERLEATETQLGLAWLVATLSTIPSLIVVGKLIRRWNELGIFIVAAFMYALRWIVYSQADSPAVLIAAQALHSMTFPLFLVASIQYLMKLVPADLRASGQAAFSVTFGGLGGIIGSAGGGYVMNVAGPQALYGFGAALAAAGFVAATATYMRGRKQARGAGSAFGADG